MFPIAYKQRYADGSAKQKFTHSLRQQSPSTTSHFTITRPTIRMPNKNSSPPHLSPKSKSNSLNSKPEFVNLQKKIALVSLLSFTKNQNGKKELKMFGSHYHSLDKILGKKKIVKGMTPKKNESVESLQKEENISSSSLIITKTCLGDNIYANKRKKYQKYTNPIKLNSQRSKDQGLRATCNAQGLFEIKKKQFSEKSKKALKKTVLIQNLGRIKEEENSFSQKISKNFKIALKFKEGRDKQKITKTEGNDLCGWTRYQVNSFKFNDQHCM